MELEVTWKRAIMVWWAYLWRTIVCMFLISLGAAVPIIVIGVSMGVPPDDAMAVISPAVDISAWIAPIVAVKSILNKSIGDFKLVLVQNTDNHHWL
jgi:hypothetical protein